MNYFFITGTSRGIGQALTQELLKNPANIVYGYSRATVPATERYIHQILDLSKTSSVLEFKFPELNNADLIVLINNSGLLGEIDHIGNVSDESLIEVFTVNTIAPVVLTNRFINQYKSLQTRKLIVNISSGAGKNPYDGWAAYCASKSALDMFSRVLEKEQEINKEGFEVYAIAPGVVDTQMQAEIRESSSEAFSQWRNFIDYKENNLLQSPETIARGLISVIFNPKSNTGTVFSLKDFV